MDDRLDDRWVVQVIEDATGDVVFESHPTSERRAEKIESGLEINLNHAAYHTKVVPAKQEVA